MLLPSEEALRLRAIPLRLHPDGDVSVAVIDPTDDSSLPRLKLATGHPIRLVVTTPSALRAALCNAYPTRAFSGRGTGSGMQRVLQRAPQPSAPALEHRQQAAELQPRQLDRPRGAVRKPKSARKSCGKTVRWTRKRS